MTILYKRPYFSQILMNSTSCKSAYIEQVYEKDNGQHTTNVHVLARRHILSGLPTNVKIINAVLGLILTQPELDALTAIKPTELFFTNNIKDVRRGIRNLLNNKRSAGVYIFTNLRTGAQLVGSSTNLGDRLSTYFTPKNIEFGKRLIFIDFRKFSFSDYKLEIFIINGEPGEILRNKTLVLEQFYIFTKSPTLNSIKVAGSTPPNTQSIERLVEHGRKLGNSHTKCFFVYINNVLVFKAMSRNLLSEVSGINQTTIYRNTAGTLIYGAIQLSTTLLENTIVNLINEKDFSALVSNLRQNNRMENVLAFKKRHETHLATQRIGVVATNLLTGQVLTANSLQEIARFLKNHNTSVSYGTIRKYLFNRKTYLN